MASISKHGEGWKVRWRERAGRNADGSTRWRARSRQCPTRRAARELQREVEEASALSRAWSPELEREAIDLREAYQLYLEHLVRAQRSASVFTATGTAIACLWAVLRVRDGQPLPATLLTREVLELVHDRSIRVDKVAPNTATRRVRTIERWWRWMHDRDLAGVPAPRRLEDLPSRVRVEAPAPTWAEVDAVIAHVVSEEGWSMVARTAWLSRCLGLRVSTCLALEWPDLDLEQRVLRVRPSMPGCKTRRERAGWRAPLPAALVPVVESWERLPGDPAVTGWRSTGRDRLGPARVSCHAALAEAWEACTERELVRRDVWAPTGRSRRPSHAFRSAWKAGLARAGVSKEVRQALVGGARGADHSYVDVWSLPVVEAVEVVPELAIVPLRPAGAHGRVR